MNTAKSHPLAEPLFTILSRLTALNGFILVLDNQLDNFRKLFRRSFEKQGIDISKVFAGFALLIRDLTVPQEQRYLEYLPAGTFRREGEEYLETVEELVSRWSAWTLVQCFEAFETYLRDITAYYYFERVPSNPIGKLKYLPIEVDRIEAWKSLFRERQWSSKTLLDQIRASAPMISNYESNNILRIDLIQWHSLFATIRHAIVHSNMKAHRSRFQASNQAISQLMPIIYSGTWSDDVYTVDLSKNNAIEIIKLTGEYSFLIFKCLCEEAGFEWQIFDTPT